MGKCTTIFSIFVLLCLLPPNIDAQPIEYKNQKENTGKTILAVKNNLLYDIALAPNIEIEVPIGRQWSLNAEYKCPWWSDSNKEICYQLLSGGIESRFWLGNRAGRRQLTGHFIGLYAEGGIYDFQYKGGRLSREILWCSRIQLWVFPSGITTSGIRIQSGHRISDNKIPKIYPVRRITSVDK